jgi:signal transduction histidine kinase/ActR/RegA family two-component response regulator
MSPPALLAARRTAQAAAGLVGLIGLCGLIGWMTGNATLKSVYSGGLSIKANASIGLVLLGLAMWLRMDAQARGWCDVASRLTAAVVGLLGALTLSQHLTGHDLGIDQLLFREAPGALGTASPNRMGPPASLCLLLAGLALSVQDRRPRLATVAQAMGVVIMVIASVPLMGYAYRVSALYSMPGVTEIALHTAIALCASGIGLVAMRPEVGFMRAVCAADAGGAVARRLLIPALLLPFLAWWIPLELEQFGWMTPALGRVVGVLFLWVGIAGLVLFNASAISRAERRRLSAELATAHVQARMADVLDNLGDAFWVVDAGLGLSYLNREAERYARQSRHVLLGLPLAEIVPWLVAEEGAAAWRQVLRDRQPRRYEVPGPGGAGWFEASLYPDRGGGVSCFLRDVTERRAADDELRRAKDAAETASRAKTEFLATLSHEMRTPLSPVVLTLSLLDGDERIPADVRADLATMRRNVELEVQLISDLLDLTRVESGKLKLEQQPIDVHGVIEAVAGMCARADAAPIQLHLQAPRSCVSGDSVRLHQIVWNLVANAQKFTDPSGVIRISTQLVGDRLRVEVSDTGVGIDPATMARLFTAFQQGPAQTARQRSGLGLGLAITRRLVEAHGGAIAAASEGAGRGSTFRVELPCLPAAAQTPVATTPDGPGAAVPPGLRIVLVEDHAPTLEAMRRLLGAMGHHVTVAASCAAALTALRQGPADLLISDIGLPDGTGLELIQQGRSAFSGPAIALTGYGTEADIKAAKAAGFAEHITKPVQVASLRAAIQRVCGGERQPVSGPTAARI